MGNAVLQGVVYDPAGDSYVLLNGHVLREKEEAEGVKILKIEADAVTIWRNGETHRLTIQQTGKEKKTE